MLGYLRIHDSVFILLLFFIILGASCSQFSCVLFWAQLFYIQGWALQFGGPYDSTLVVSVFPATIMIQHFLCLHGATMTQHFSQLHGATTMTQHLPWLHGATIMTQHLPWLHGATTMTVWGWMYLLHSAFVQDLEVPRHSPDIGRRIQCPCQTRFEGTQCAWFGFF